MVWYPIRVSVQVLAILLPIQIPGNVPGEEVEDDTSPCASASMWQKWKKLLFPGFSLASFGYHSHVGVNQ